jgi:hypothetical protein
VGESGEENREQGGRRTQKSDEYKAHTSNNRVVGIKLKTTNENFRNLQL